MISRQITTKILALWGKLPVLTITGPRQSGKTKLIKSIDLGIPYISIEAPDIRQFAIEDPRGFLGNYPKGVIIDEVQLVPELFSYIQEIVDSTDRRFVLSGSQNFQLLERISQSLAGRSSILKLMPLSLSEIKEKGAFNTYHEYIFKGSYPRLYDIEMDPQDYYPSYINTYIERDVRTIKNIENLSLFTKFLKLCAGRIGQPLNVRNLANDVGISPNTADSWLSVLETSYIIHFVEPYYKNYNKRIIKSPKLYFWDTGVACSLMGIENTNQLPTFHSIGNLFENMIVNEFLKSLFNEGLNSKLYFWQNRNRKEIDLVIDNISGPIPIEIKSGSSINRSYFDNLNYWNKMTDSDQDQSYVIYGGEEDFSFGNQKLVSWKNSLQILE